MSDRETIAALYRRAAFGVPPGELDELESLGVDEVIDRMVDPGAYDIPPGPADIWADVDVPGIDSIAQSFAMNGPWIDQMAFATRPFEEWMAWYWHGHLVSGLIGAFAHEMAVQINLFRSNGLGSFKDLLKDITLDAAMLRYLDGDTSSGDNPNENYSRELVELFALGIGNYTQDDVVAGAVALSGWRVDSLPPTRPGGPSIPRVFFDPALHDDTPQRYLGRSVHDVDTVIDAVVSQEACAAFVAARFGRAVLGPEVDEAVLDGIATRFRDADLDLREMARATLEAVADGHATPLIRGPLSWLVGAQMVTGTVLPNDQRSRSLSISGQFPLFPPNVAGWPGGRQWLAASTTTERMNMASALASGADESSLALQAAAEGDLDLLADLLSHPEGFTEPTRAALEDLREAIPNDNGAELLTVALASPDMVMA